MCIQFSACTGEPQEWKSANTTALKVSCQGCKTMKHPETSPIGQPTGLFEFRLITWDHDGVTWVQPIGLQSYLRSNSWVWTMLGSCDVNHLAYGVSWGQTDQLGQCWGYLRSTNKPVGVTWGQTHGLGPCRSTQSSVKKLLKTRGQWFQFPLPVSTKHFSCPLIFCPSALLRSHLEYCIQLRGLQDMKDIDPLECSRACSLPLRAYLLLVSWCSNSGHLASHVSLLIGEITPSRQLVLS